MDAMVDLFLQHRQSLRALARQLLREDSSADDVVQEAATIALRQAPDELRDGKGWLSTVVRRLAFRSRRGEQRRARREVAVALPADAPDVATPTATALERAETLRLLANSVAELELPFRRAVVLRYIEELPTATIAQREGIAEATVRTRLHRALAVLRTKLDARMPGGRAEWLSSMALLADGSGCGASAVGLGAGAKIAASLLLVAAGGLLWGFLRRVGRDASDSDPSTASAAVTLATPPFASSPFAGMPNAPTIRPAAPTSGADSLDAPEEELTTVRGRVVDEQGLPLADIRIAAAELFVAAGRQQTIWHADSVTGADGRFALPGLHVGGSLGLMAGRPGLAPADQEGLVPIRADLELPDLVVGHGATLAGVVVDADGSPVVGATVMASGSFAGSAFLPEPPPSGHPAPLVGAVQFATTDAGGGFRLTGLVPNDGLLGVRVEPPASARSDASPLAASAFSLAPGESARLVIGAPARGRIVVLGGLSKGVIPDVAIDAFAPWLTERQRSVLPQRARRIEAVAEERAADASGPGEGGDGGFTFSFVCTDAPAWLRVRVEVPGRPLAEQFVEISCGADKTLEFTLSSTPTVSGFIVDPAGAPVAGARVRLLGEPWLDFDSACVGRLTAAAPQYVAWLGGSDFQPTVSAEDGRFETPARAAGRATLLVHAKGYSPCAVDRSFTSRVPGEVTIALQRCVRELALALPPAPVDPFNPHLHPWCVTVAATGLDAGAGGATPIAIEGAFEGEGDARRLVVRDLPAGSLEVVVAPGHWPTGVPPMPAATKLEIGAEESGRIERTVTPPACGALLLRLFDGSGAPERGAKVALQDVHGAPLLHIDTGGLWVDAVAPWSPLLSQGAGHPCCALPAGPVRVVITSSDGVQREAATEIVAGLVAEVTSRRAADRD
jgi:RNA polymerase sigma-70 factor (ECF subfamily)